MPTSTSHALVPGATFRLRASLKRALGFVKARERTTWHHSQPGDWCLNLKALEGAVLEALDIDPFVNDERAIQLVRAKVIVGKYDDVDYFYVPVVFIDRRSIRSPA